MIELFNSMKTPAWWISVFGVGIAINILSVYVHKWAGFGFRSLLLRLLHLKEADDKRVAHDVELLAKSEAMRAVFISRQIAASLRTVCAFLLGIMFLSVLANMPADRNANISLIVITLITIFSMCAVVLNVMRAQYCEQVIQTAAALLQDDQKQQPAGNRQQPLSQPEGAEQSAAANGS